MITKQVAVDKIEVTENDVIQVRTVTRLIEEGEILSQTYHRHCLSPGDDLSGQDPRVVVIARAAWENINT